MPRKLRVDLEECEDGWTAYIKHLNIVGGGKTIPEALHDLSATFDYMRASWKATKASECTEDALLVKRRFKELG